MRVPVQPIGWPSAIAPPLTFSRSVGIGTSLQHREHLRREGFVQLDEIEVVERRARSARSSFCIAGTGPMPMIRGSTPALAQPMMRASGVQAARLRARRRSSARRAAPPSVMPDDVPAVMMPGVSFDVRRRPSGSFLSASIVVSGARMLVGVDASASCPSRP